MTVREMSWLTCQDFKKRVHNANRYLYSAYCRQPLSAWKQKEDFGVKMQLLADDDNYIYTRRTSKYIEQNDNVKNKQHVIHMTFLTRI